MVFEYCAGTLGDAVHERCEGPPDPLQQITSGLAFLHSLKIVHNNLKPSNILVSFPTKNTPPQMKLADIGLRHKIKKNEKKNNVWRAPESNVITPAFDVYCLGQIFCFILSKGLFPTKINLIEFIKFVKQVTEQEPLTFCWSEAMLELINSMLMLEAEKRPTASEVLHHHVFAAKSSPDSQQGIKNIPYPFKSPC